MAKQVKTHEKTDEKLGEMVDEAQEFIFESNKLMERYSLARARKIRKILDGISREKVALRKIMIKEES